METRRVLLCACVLGTLIVGASLAQSTLRDVKGLGVSLRYNPEYFSEHDVKQEPRLTMQEVGTDIPIGVAPAHAVVSLMDKRPLPALDQGPRYFSPSYSSIAVIPLKDSSVKSYAKSYPDVSSEATSLGGVLARRPMTFGPKGTPPDLNNEDIEQAFHSRIRYLDFPLFSAISYLTAYTQEEDDDPVNNEQLSLVVEGLTKDGRYYIDARFAITHPSLPKSIDSTKPMKGLVRKQHLLKASKDLNALADDSFWPPIASFKDLLASLAIE
jgi:hypothetical protein